MADIVIVGAGPGGSALACYLAMAGADVVVFEAANHPRPHVGESLLLACNPIFRDIGVWEALHERGFTRKRGVVWHPTTDAGRSFATSFQRFSDAELTEDSYAFHVDRAELDLLLLKRAEALGARIIQGVAAERVCFDGEAAAGVVARVAGQEVTVPARLVVDASGRRALLAGQLGIKRCDPILDQQAVFAWFEGVDRGPAETSDYLHVHHLPVERGWMWQIPIRPGATSLGVVVDRDSFRQTSGDLGQRFHDLAGRSPSAARALADARPLTDFKAEGNYSYNTERYTGDGYLLLGDASRFIDPIFASGVAASMQSARFAAEAILAAGDYRRRSLEPYEARSRAMSDVWHEFARLYYRLPSLWAFYLVRDSFEASSREFVELVTGLVTDRSQTRVLDEMRALVDLVESSPEHVWKDRLRPEPEPA